MRKRYQKQPPEMTTQFSVKYAEQVSEAIEGGMKKAAIAKRIGISRPTLDKRLKTDDWQQFELDALRKIGLVQ